MEVQRLSAWFPCCCGTKHGTPDTVPQSMGCVSLTHQVLHMAQGISQAVGQGLDTVWQILVVLSVPVDHPVPVACEHLQPLTYRIPPFR